ncbi:MAG: type II secretion system minor pseudopilin GspK [Nitrospinota bacterium]|nr:type II secretion system minor pseudopilin GspK [Nitrospinota bacterium]
MIMAIMVVLILSALAFAMLEAQRVSIRRAKGVAERAVSMEIARSAISNAALTLASSAPSDLGSAGEDCSLPEGLDLTGGSPARVVVYDEQGKINLNNMLAHKKPNARGIRTFIELLKSLSLPLELADTLTDWIDPDSERRWPDGAEDEYYIGLTPSRLAGNRFLIVPMEMAMIKGFDKDVIDKLSPHITALPRHVRLNVNAATAHALAAAIPGLDVREAEMLVKERMERPFADREDFIDRLPLGVTNVHELYLTVDGEFYRITAEVASSRAWAAAEALVRVGMGAKRYEIIWQRSI